LILLGKEVDTGWWAWSPLNQRLTHQQ